MSESESENGIEGVQEFGRRVQTEVARVVVGLEREIEACLIAALAEGHVLLEGPPGVAKTLLVRALAVALGGRYGRVQFTPDLMPSDVTGTSVFHPSEQVFRFQPGPLFAQILLCDEINRAPAKTQAALLEAMQEGAVTVDGVRHELPRPFLVFATMNPIEHEGTYPLPEAQLDRFLFKVQVGYPAAEVEERILAEAHERPPNATPSELGMRAVSGPDELRELSRRVARVLVREDLPRYVVRLLAATRASASLVLGASPRAGVVLLRAAKARAALLGRDYVTPDDVKALFCPALRHRVMLDPTEEIEGATSDAVLTRLADQVEVPALIPTQRTIATSAVLALCSLAAALEPAAEPFVWALDLLFLAVLALDFVRTPRPASLPLARKCPARARLGHEFTRVARVEPGRAAGLVLELREEFPAEFEVLARARDGGPAPPRDGDPTGGPDRVRLARSGASEIARTYRSHLRGVHELGDVRVRLTSPWGLLQRQARLAGRHEIAIEPALAGLKRALRLAASERWRDLGVRTLRRRGGMTDFESLRDYVHGDDVRLVDWKAFARRGKPTVRQFQVERGQELILLVDCGRRMAAATAEGRERGWTKLDHALDAALELAAVALQEGDRVGLVAFDAEVRAWVPPQRGKRALSRLIEAVFALQASRTESDLARALRETELRHRRSALLAILSDVADPLSVEPQRAALARSGRRQRVLFAALDDPSVRAAADGRGSNRGSSAAVRAAAAHLVQERRAALRQLARTGARVLDALPAEAAGPLLAAWLDARSSAGAARGVAAR